MKRTVHTWLLFGACLAVVLAAMGWVSAEALRLGGAEAAARQRADREERTRLALWRMESMAAPLVALEVARPQEHYSETYDAGLPE